MQTEILMPKYFGAVNLEALEDNAAEESAGRKTGSKSTAGDTIGKKITTLPKTWTLHNVHHY